MIGDKGECGLYLFVTIGMLRLFQSQDQKIAPEYMLQIRKKLRQQLELH